VAGLPALALRRLRDRSLRLAQCNVVIGTRMARRLADLGIPSERVQIIHNWCDGTAIRPLPFEGHALRKAWRLEERFVVMYSGNMGYAHEFGTMLDAADRLRDRADIVFVLVGAGVQRGRVEQKAAGMGLGNVQFKPYQPRQALAQSLSAANAHLISLLPEMEGLMGPSKFYAAAAAGRPILFIGAGDGELATLIAESGCGVQVQPGNGEALAERIRALAEDPECAQRQGRAARRLFEQRFERRLGRDAWCRVLRSAVPGARIEVLGVDS
jgi:glycosyltransferase involved in cell wall biosynthesis